MAEAIKVYGAPWCPDCRRSKQFLGEMRVAYDWIDIAQEPAGAEIVREKNQGKQIIPTIVFEDGSSLAEPSNDELAKKLGLVLKAKRTYYDLIVIGGGPTGLTAGIYAAREGMDCLIIEKSALGGQAGVTEQIDNYPGFPKGIGGAELAERMTSRRAVTMWSCSPLSACSRSRVTATTSWSSRRRATSTAPAPRSSPPAQPTADWACRARTS